MTTQRTTRAQFLQRKQVAGFRRDEHYDHVEAVGKNRKKEELRKKRFDLIVKHNIKKGERVQIAPGFEILVKYIDIEGLIISSDFETIDLLNFIEQ